MQKDTDPEREGVVVRADKSHIVVWNADDDLVVATGNDKIDELDLASWVKYKAFEITDKDGPWKENITKQIYDIEEVEPKRLSAKSHISIKVQGFLKLHRKLKFNASGYALAQDDILRLVHVPKDEELVRRLEDGQTVEVYVVFMENHMKPSHWFAVCMNVGGTGAAENWKMLTGLSERVEEAAKFPYVHMPSPDDLAKLRKGFSDLQVDSKGETETASSSLPYFTTPEGYTGPVRETKKTISQVLGVVVSHEREGTVSVVYTRFGLARVEKSFLTGTWLNMKIYEDDPDTPKKERPTAAYKMGTHYLVREWEKIKPPMSTRVVELNSGEERLLICGIIKGDNDGWDNRYLGKIDDEGGIMQKKVLGFTSSYMVEMCVFKSIQSHGGLCWRVVKFHGAAIPNVNSVPLHLSIMPQHQGRTGDEVIDEVVPEVTEVVD